MNEEYVVSFRIPCSLKTKVEQHPQAGCRSANQTLRAIAIAQLALVGIVHNPTEPEPEPVISQEAQAAQASAYDLIRQIEADVHWKFSGGEDPFEAAYAKLLRGHSGV